MSTLEREQYLRAMAAGYGRMVRRDIAAVQAELEKAGIEEAPLLAEALVMCSMQEMADRNFRGPM